MGKTSSVTHVSNRTSGEQSVSQRKTGKGKQAGRTFKQETTSSVNKGMSLCTKVALAATAVAAAALLYSYTSATPSKTIDLRAELQKGFEVIDLKLGNSEEPSDLSAAHLASVLDDPSVLHLLHEAGNPIDKKDEFGFTPLHYMAMQGNLAGVRTLLKWGADPTHKNALGGNLMDILRLIEPWKPSDLPLDPTLFSAHRYHNTDVDPKCLPKDVTFITENVARPDQLFRMLGKIRYHSKDRQLPIDKTELTRYQAFQRSPPHLSIEPITHDDAGNSLNLGSNFCGVIAKQAIKQGDVIAEYAGQMFADNVVSQFSEYLWIDWPDIDSSKFRSVGAMFNTGFPNAIVNPWFAGEKIGLDGVPYRKIITALDDIAAGDQIIIFYGGKYKESKPHVELRPHAVKEYAKQNNWHDLVENFNSYMKIKQCDIGKMSKLLALIESTSKLEELAKEGLISHEDLSQIKAIIQKYNL